MGRRGGVVLRDDLTLNVSVYLYLSSHLILSLDDHHRPVLIQGTKKNTYPPSSE